MQKAKMYGVMFATIPKQGFMGAKKDINLFM